MPIKCNYRVLLSQFSAKKNLHFFLKTLYLFHLNYFFSPSALWRLLSPFRSIHFPLVYSIYYQVFFYISSTLIHFRIFVLTHLFPFSLFYPSFLSFFFPFYLTCDLPLSSIFFFYPYNQHSWWVPFFGSTSSNLYSSDMTYCFWADEAHSFSPCSHVKRKFLFHDNLFCGAHSRSCSSLNTTILTVSNVNGYLSY